MKRKLLYGAVMSVFLLFSCVHTDGEPGKSPELREDTAPLTRRFPKLGKIEKAFWTAGMIGDSSLPGPSSYYLKGYLFLSPEQADKFKKTFSWNPAEISPAMKVPGLDPGTFTWLFSREFNLFIKSADYAGRFYLTGESNIVFFDIER